ncbi:PEP-CTERM sorting domain-containing protein [Paludisphaera soli]|uniref:PEP-CTERM sorting domain-containing protein n=1 Tax=Paludisphaera soli TaxID=2712865 RepID=UPI00197F7530|nr:PEP-CTERM sorting domain-containing protein [Paludisphaera soli]
MNRLATFRSMIPAALCGTLALAASAPARADFDPQIGQPGSKGIAATSPLFQGWATSVAGFERGPQNAANPAGPLANVGTPENALGDPSSGLVSLGDGGSITLGFDAPIADGAGADFAVFENGFLASAGSFLAYLELAFVEVSTDGVNFFRFAATSLTQTSTQVGGFGMLDARDLDNLAGKYVAGYGTGFDLAELAGVSPLLDVRNVNFVRIVDVVGSIDPAYGSYDSLGNLVNDPYATPFGSSGFDLTGVGVINFAPAPAAVPEPSSLALAGIGLLVTAALRACRRAA